jgi:outer membrane usher protein FimD/PapC
VYSYFYPSARDSKDVYEIYAGVSKGWFSGKLWFGPSWNSEKEFYAEANAALPFHDFTFGVHTGYSGGSYWSNGTKHYDYSLGVSRKVAKFDVNLKYVNSNDLKDPNGGRNAWIGTVSTTLPWK